MLFQKKNMAVVLVVILSLKMMAVPLLYAQYAWNKTYIANNLCENRAKPQLHCEGKCHLSKEVKKNTDVPDSQNEKPGFKNPLTEFFHTDDVSFPYHQATIALLQSSDCSSMYSILYSRYIFHPPLAC